MSPQSFGSFSTTYRANVGGYQWLVWSNECRAWWADQEGDLYTRDIAEAARFAETVARAIVDCAPFGPAILNAEGLLVPDDVMVLAP